MLIWPKPTPDEEAIEAPNLRGEGLSDVARRCDVHPRTLKRLVVSTERVPHVFPENYTMLRMLFIWRLPCR
jgi:hypothetical protein